MCLLFIEKLPYEEFLLQSKTTCFKLFLVFLVYVLVIATCFLFNLYI